MKIEEIEAEARIYSSIQVGGPRHLEDFFESEKFEAGFIDGAKWRVNSVWHESSETPNKEKELLILDHNNRPWVIRPGHIWEQTVEIFCAKKWAYIEDLLPIKED